MMFSLLKEINISRLSINLICIILLANSIFAYWSDSISSNNIDFFTLWSLPNSPNNLAAENVYSESEEESLAANMLNETKRFESDSKLSISAVEATRRFEGKILIASTPFLYAIVGLLSTGVYERDLMNFVTLSVFCLFIAFFLLCSLANYSKFVSMVMFSMFLMFYTPLIVNMNDGNVSSVQLMLIAIFIYFSKSNKNNYVFISGLVIGLSIMFKPNVVYVLIFNMLFLATCNAYRKLSLLTLGVILSSIACIVVSSVFFGGFGVWSHFVNRLFRTISHSYSVIHGNVSLSNLIYYFTDIDLSLIILIFLSLLFVFVVAKYKNNNIDIKSCSVERHKENIYLKEAFCIVGVGIEAMLLSSGLAWCHYYILLIPIIILLINPARELNSNTKNYIFINILTSFSLVMLTSISKNFVSSYIGLSVMFNISTFIIMIMTFNELLIKSPADIDP